MAWKIPQSDDSPRGAGGQGGQIQLPWRGSFDKSGFHGVEKRHNLGSMPWKNGEFDFHGVENQTVGGQNETVFQEVR
jgi:hypothetical protein